MRILVATDGSKDADAAVEWLTHLPLPEDSSVEVVSVMPDPEPSDAIGSPLWRDVRMESEHVVDDAVRRIAKRRTAVTGRVLAGAEPCEAILDAAVKGKSDLIVLGARGLGAMGSVLLGSVSLGVSRHAPCPVLICKGMPRPVRAVTVALDGSAGARAALEFLTALPLPSDLTVCLVGVVEPLRRPTTAPGFAAPILRGAIEDLECESRNRLNEALAPSATALRPRVRRVVTVTPTGSPAAAILHKAEHYECDLIVVGARGLGALRRIALGSVSESVLRNAVCPVLIVRPSPPRSGR
jgi:nucleotide-binding universal stress UspA family protein